MLKPTRTSVPAIRPVQGKPSAAKPAGMSQAATILQARMERRPAPPVYRPAPPPVTQPKTGLPSSFSGTVAPTPKGRALPVIQSRMPAPAFQSGRNFIRAGVVQRQVSAEEADEFLKGKKLTKFTDAQLVKQEVEKQKYQVEKQKYMPNFDSEVQEDVSLLQRRAELLLQGLRGQPQQMIGVPPSLKTEVYLPNSYLSHKKTRQQQRRHIDVEKGEIENRIVEIRDDKDATNVTAYLYIDGALTQLREPTNNVNPFGRPFGQSSPEITASEHDSEARLLNKVLETCRNDFAGSQYDEDEHTYELALVGPHGACDGCKDRLRLFKQQWKLLMEPAQGPRSLVITYFYTQETSKQRSNTTRYGWTEALVGEVEFTPKKTVQERKKGKNVSGTQKVSYSYRSMNTQTPGTPG